LELIYLRTYTGLSLFSGAGGMDVGFKKAGVKILWSNELDKDACNTYQANHPESTLFSGDIRNAFHELENYKGTDILFGGPPCQGFSVAGKMDPNDERSTLIWTYLDVVNIIKPKAFVLENVSALAKLDKWKDVRTKMFQIANEMGYSCYPFLLNSANFGVPQKRERVFFIGLLNKDIDEELMTKRISLQEKIAKSIRETIVHLGPAGSSNNPHTCEARITLASNPVMRKSPYAGMIFNGMGRPLDLEGISNTLPASMGGNKTPIVDEALLHKTATDNWIVDYHRSLMEGNAPEFLAAPSRLRRLTLKEAALIQTFPEDYIFKGSKSAVYRQIGNAVPCLLAQAVATAVIDELNNKPMDYVDSDQLSIHSFIRNSQVIDKEFISI
jgi:DNA (cytosine-5)-methyltransferase 1